MIFFSLENVRQCEGETLKDFLTMLKEVMNVEGLEDKINTSLLTNAIGTGPLFVEFDKNQSRFHIEALSRIAKHVNIK